MRHDLTVQAISDMLGFDEQATFSRYFRRETGLSPSEFRSTDNGGGDEKRRECFVTKEK
jgi:AraC-like DNA-binding protein